MLSFDALLFDGLLVDCVPRCLCGAPEFRFDKGFLSLVDGDAAA
ncbi:MAG: hypothetical protein WBQ57_09665 [Rhodanobacteraceae bacterium]